jgi:hypothetical protein
LEEEGIVRFSEEFSMGFRRHSTLHCMLLIFCCGLPVCAAWAATPTVTLTAGNVSISDRGAGTSQFMLTSLNGFTGQVSVVCAGPNPGPLELVLPVCSPNSQILTVPANGSISGTLQFNPPWVISGSLRQDLPGPPGRAPLGMPMTAGGLAAACLLGSRMRRDWRRRLGVMVLAAAGLVGLSSLTGCIGQGGLAMTPGSYTYTIIGENSFGQLETSKDITVTIHE